MPVLKRILVATDLSAAGERAVMRAGQLARQWEANLFLVHARPDWNLVVIGRREPQAAHIQSGPMGGVGFRIAYHAAADVLVLSS